MLTHPDLLPDTDEPGELIRRQQVLEGIVQNEVFRHCVAAAQLDALVAAMQSKGASEREDARHLFNALELVMEKLAITIGRGEHAGVMEARKARTDEDGTP